MGYSSSKFEEIHVEEVPKKEVKMLLSNKVAIITGGARGIGRGIAMKFAEEGCSPVIVDVLAAEGRKTAEELSKKERNAVFIKCDITDRSQVKEMVDQVIGKFGKVDILINNAGITGLPKSVTDINEEEWDRVLSINLKGMFLCCKTVVPHMKEKGYGKIVNISSLSAIYPVAPMVHYSASKAGVLGLTLDLALELAPFNICVNVILPGAIPSDMWNMLIPPGVNREEFLAEIEKAVMPPMQRLGTPEDIAGVALFLASDLSRYVTGDRIIVGGGTPLRKLH
jgi:NAD(P)-dependent dehydrogenase (short-subunit alcohol dehydrogenase family)